MIKISPHRWLNPALIQSVEFSRAYDDKTPVAKVFMLGGPHLHDPGDGANPARVKPLPAHTLTGEEAILLFNYLTATQQYPKTNSPATEETNHANPTP